MIFSSLQYLLFLPVVVLLFWRTTGNTRLWILLVASYLFYMSWMPAYGLLLFGLTLINWLLGLVIGKDESTESSGRFSVRNTAFWSGIVLNVGCLFYYKYTNFFLKSLADFYNSIAGGFAYLSSEALTTPLWNPPLIDVILPLAISFFVFEFVHYLSDIYRGGKPVSSLLHFSVFAAFFPSQIAGPIKRYQDFLDKLLSPERFCTKLFYEGSTLFMQGLFKKVAIADPIGYLIQPYFQASSALSAGDAWLAAVGFVIQVYCDFSGYTDMGRGSALLMGIRLPENFNLPFLAVDITDFWRRWHMSLSFWLRDYIYIPLGGSRVSKVMAWRNTFLTMVVCGLWHGANWHYVIFGALQGVGMIVNREYRLLLERIQIPASVIDSNLARSLGLALNMLFVTFTFAVFRAPDMPHAFNLLGSLLNFGGETSMWVTVVKAGILPILGIYMSCWALTYWLQNHPDSFTKLRSNSTGYAYPVKLAAWTTACILMIAVRPVVAVPFVYFQF